MPESKKILIIEDDEDIVDLLSIHLKDLGCSIEKAFDGTTGLQKALSATFDLIILDLMLPGIDGMEVCRRVRMKNEYVPILMLTAKSEEIDKVLGLETGADDYLTKPFSVREFISRVKAIFRRVEALTKTEKVIETAAVLTFKNLIIDPAKRKITLNGDRLSLTPKEYDLLYKLASNPGRSYSREELLNLVWGYEFSGYEHTVNSHINRLRSKIETDIANPEFILTAWGIGYRFNDDF